MPKVHWTLAIALLLVISTIASPVHGDENGHFTFTASGYPITGQLTNAVIHQNGTVTITMLIDQNIPTKLGTVHIVGNGVWNGNSDNSSLAGTIGDVRGSAQACFLIFCQEADFAGTGTWTGMLMDAGSGSGTFQGTLTFNGSPLAPSGPVPISGTWETAFRE